MTDILFITQQQCLRNFISYVSRLMSCGNNR